MTIEDTTNSIAGIIPVVIVSKLASDMLNNTNKRYRQRYKKGRKFKW